MKSTSAVLSHYPGHPADPAPGQPNLIRPLLDLALAQTSAQGAYVYRFEAAGTGAQLAAWAGLAPHQDSGFRLDLADPKMWQSAKRTPVVLHENAWSDWRFRGLAEFERHRFEGVVSVPLSMANNRLEWLTSAARADLPCRRGTFRCCSTRALLWPTC